MSAQVIYTTNAIESLNYSMRKFLKMRGAFPCCNCNYLNLPHLGLLLVSTA
jgi:transposase-like protein